MESPFREWLLSEAPGWDDDVVCAARFRVLTGQRTDWEARFHFWRSLILSLARHLRLLVLDTHAVQHSWFLRGGLTPLCITQVLVEMQRCGDVRPLDSWQAESTLGWLWGKLQKTVSGETTSTDFILANQLAVTALVHERIFDVAKSISESCWTESCITTMDRFIEVCGGDEEASILKKELLRTKRGVIFVTEGSSPIVGIKVSSTQDSRPNASKLDSYMLHLYWTLEKLHVQMASLEKAYNRSKQAAMNSLKHDRITAKRHVQSMRTLAASKQKCVEFQGKIQDVLAFISQAEMTKQVSQAMKVGADALKEHLIPIKDIEGCIREVDEAILHHKEVADVLGYAMEDGEVEELDLELAELELKESSEPSKISSEVGESNAGQEPPEPPLGASLDAVEDALKGLSLQSEPV